MKIAVDPGHGGNDSGAVGPSGLKESDTVLLICEQIVRALERAGLETKLTRTCDVFVELGRRCDIANDWCADYFVSVHCNSDGPSAIGIETLYKSSKGEALAKPIQEMMVMVTGDEDRGLKYRSDLYVLNGTEMPAALAETGFISNPETEKLFKGAEYKKIIAQAIVAGILKHLNIRPVEHPAL